MRLDHLLSKENRGGGKTPPTQRGQKCGKTCCSILSEPKQEKEQMVERKTYKYGGVAQLGEHLPCKQGVMGSNPIISTSPEARTGNHGEVHRKFKSSHEGGVT